MDPTLASPLSFIPTILPPRILLELVRLTVTRWLCTTPTQPPPPSVDGSYSCPRIKVSWKTGWLLHSTCLYDALVRSRTVDTIRYECSTVAVQLLSSQAGLVADRPRVRKLSWVF